MEGSPEEKIASHLSSQRKNPTTHPRERRGCPGWDRTIDQVINSYSLGGKIVSTFVCFCPHLLVCFQRRNAA